MKEVIDYIKIQENKFAKLSFFQFLKDSNIGLEQRLTGLSCLAYLAMVFQELHSDVVNNESGDHPLQKLLNRYLLEDAINWKPYLKYLETLEIDQALQYSESLQFRWSGKTLKTRRLANNLVSKCRYETDIVLKIVIIEAIEATGSPALNAMAHVIEELWSNTYKRSICPGKKHEETENLLFSIELSPEQKAKALVLVDYVFDSFTEYMNGLMQLAEQHNCKELLAQPEYALNER